MCLYVFVSTLNFFIEKISKQSYKQDKSVQARLAIHKHINNHTQKSKKSSHVVNHVFRQSFLENRNR